jgi:hypothetical protein
MVAAMTIDTNFGVYPGQNLSAAWDSPIGTFELHQSQLNTLVGMCAKRFEFEHIQMAPKSGNVSEYRLSMGLAAHHVVESVMKGSDKTVGRLMSEQWDAFVMPNLLNYNYDKAIKEFTANIEGALEWLRDRVDPGMTIAEKPFKIPKAFELSPILEGIDERWSFAGSMDLIELDHNKMTAKIWDMKFRDKSNFVGNRASSQAQMYSLAAMYYGYTPTFTYVEFVRGKILEQEIKVDSGALDWLFLKARQAIDFIETSNYPMNPNGWHCSKKYCSYWDSCRGKYESDPLLDAETQET